MRGENGGVCLWVWWGLVGWLVGLSAVREVGFVLSALSSQFLRFSFQIASR